MHEFDLDEDFRKTQLGAELKHQQVTYVCLVVLTLLPFRLLDVSYLLLGMLENVLNFLVAALFLLLSLSRVMDYDCSHFVCHCVRHLLLTVSRPFCALLPHNIPCRTVVLRTSAHCGCCTAQQARGHV